MLRNDLYEPWFANEKDWGFHILSGEFGGTYVQIESIEFSDKQDGTVDLKFHVVKQPDDLRELDTQNPLFNSTVELIINDILKEAVEIARNDESTGSNNTSEPDQQ